MTDFRMNSDRRDLFGTSHRVTLKQERPFLGFQKTGINTATDDAPRPGENTAPVTAPLSRPAPSLSRCLRPAVTAPRAPSPRSGCQPVTGGGKGGQRFSLPKTRRHCGSRTSQPGVTERQRERGQSGRMPGRPRTPS